LSARKCLAFSPAGISSFFEICDTTPSGKPILDPRKIGARGGGFALEKGVLTQVDLKKSKEPSLQIAINGKHAPEAETTKTVVEMLLQEHGNSCNVTVRHKVDVPIAAGFGTSAGGALGTALALSKLLKVNLTMSQIGQIAHIAEVKSHTGLGTVGPLLVGGCCLTVEPGAPGHSLIDRLPTLPHHRLVTGFHKALSTKELLALPKIRQRVNSIGRQTLDKILTDPSLGNFLAAAREFAIETGLASSKIAHLFEVAEEAGAIGVAQNMVGEAVHALTTANNAKKVVEAFKSILPPENILTGRIDAQGAHLLM
jgi:pantoate kinase